MHRLAPPLLGGNSQCHWLLLRRKRVVPALALVVLAGLGTLQSAAVAEPKKFLLGTDDSEQLLSGQWLRRIYGEAFKRLGLPLEVVVAPLSRLEALLERGEIDADAMRGPSYAARHPELIPVEIPRIRTYFAIYALKPIDDLQSLQDLSAGKLSGAYRRGVVGCQDTLEALLPKRRLTAVNNLDVGLRMMASRHADFYCDVSLGVSNYLPKPGQPPKPLKLFEIGRPFSNSIYLHPKHAGLATELAATFRQMEAEGLLAESGLEAKPPPDVNRWFFTQPAWRCHPYADRYPSPRAGFSDGFKEVKMLSFQNLKVGARLALGFGAVMVLLIIISALGVRGASQIAADTSVIYQDRMLPLLQLAKVNSLMLQNRVLLTEMIQAPARLDQLSAVMANNTEEVTKLLEAYTATAMKPDEASLAASFLDMRGRYGDEGIVPARAALKQGATEIAHQIYAEKVVVLARQTQEALDKLMAWQVSKGAKDYGAAQEGYSQVLRVSATGTLLAIAVAAWLAWTVSRSITVPTRQALALAERVAAGDLSVSLHAAGRNEMAQLLNALGRMTESLRNIVGQVRDSSESISTGSAEIAIGNADLSQRTEVQASNLQQTAATMEELSSTVRNNAQTATQANELAHSASVAAGRGGSVVGELVSNMAAISQSSHRISDIIGVIDGIAFQTNILALNAAVEAARAGEQGRGFAVVAGEVRSLAQRSAEAAREIKSLIGDSQTKVENGNRLADQAGGAMQDIVREVGRVSSMIAEIANASGEQSRGISQVGEAVGQLDQVTQQNAALVEQSAAAAESLRNQAGQLWELVASFRLR